MHMHHTWAQHLRFKQRSARGSTLTSGEQNGESAPAPRCQPCGSTPQLTKGSATYRRPTAGSNRTAAGAAQHAARHAESEAARHGQRQSWTSHALPRPTAKPTAVSFAMTAAAVIIITSLHQAAVRRWCMYSDGSVIWCPNVRSSWKQKQMSVETSVRATDLGGRCIAAPHRHVPRSRHAGPGKWSRLPKCGRDAV